MNPSPSSPSEAPHLRARVILSSPGALSEVDERLLVDVLAEYGADPRLEIELDRADHAFLAWIVLAVLPLQAFLSALGSKAADDAYAKIRGLVRRLASPRHTPDAVPPAVQKARTHGPPPLILMDADTGLQIVLEADLPSDAYRQLVAIDLSQYRFGPLHYDKARRRWRSERDEAAAHRRPQAPQ